MLFASGRAADAANYPYDVRTHDGAITADVAAAATTNAVANSDAADHDAGRNDAAASGDGSAASRQADGGFFSNGELARRRTRKQIQQE